MSPSLSRACLFLALLAGVAASAAPRSAGAQSGSLPSTRSPDSASPRGVAGRVHGEGGYSDRLPVAGADGAARSFPNDGFEGEGGSGGRANGRGRNAGTASGRGGGRAPSTAPRDGGSSSSFGLGAGSTVLSYALMGLGVLLLLAIFVTVLYSLRPGGGQSLPTEAPMRDDADRHGAARPPPGLIAAPGDPDALAAAGRFEDAIAAVLIASLRHVGWRPIGFERSRTAREILSSVARADDRYPPLRDLVRLQELVAFGGEDATEERYHAARALFDALSRPRSAADALEAT